MPTVDFSETKTRPMERGCSKLSLDLALTHDGYTTVMLPSYLSVGQGGFKVLRILADSADL